MNKFHILGSVALAFSLFFTLGTAATQAQDGSEFAGGNGTEENPWQIATKQQLAAVENYGGEIGNGKHFILTKDLKFTTADFSTFGDFYNDGKFWIPLCEYPDRFQGTLDGNNHTISGIRGTLFDCLEGGTIKNLNISLSANASVSAGLAQFVYKAIISNCHVTGNITEGWYNSGFFSGGLVAQGSVLHIVDSSFKGNIGKENSHNCCGGIVGGTWYGEVVVSNCSVEGEIKGEGGSCLGGICGAPEYSSITIHGCSVIGSIEGRSYEDTIGGLIGLAVPSNVNIVDSYFEGNITSKSSTGGLIGWFNNSSLSTPTLTIRKSYASGKIVVEGDRDLAVGGLVGYLYGNGGILDSYSNTEIKINGAKDGWVGETVGAGGIVGECHGSKNNEFTISNCYSHSEISSRGTTSLGVGGIVGIGNNCIVLNSYAMGELMADQTTSSAVDGKHAYIGGIWGCDIEGIWGCDEQEHISSIQSCVAMNHSLTAPHGDKEDIARIIGSEGSCTLDDNYALDTMILKISNKDMSVTGTANDKNGLAKSASVLAQKSTYTDLDWDFDNTWKMSVNGYPIFIWQEDTPLPTAPSITSQPVSQTVNVGSSVTFSVTATGTEPLSYQWKKNGSDISGATDSTYKINSVQTSDAGSYTVTVSNSVDSVTSSAATLTVNVPVTLSSITINGSSSVDVGSTATYTCTATYSNGTTKTVTPTWAISSGANYASITSAGVLTGKAAGTATVKATYEGKTATKNVTVNEVVVMPKIITQPKSQTVNEGDSVTFTVVAEDGNSSSNADFSVPLSGNVNLDMVWIEPGTFTMGKPINEGGFEGSYVAPQHQVTLTKGFWAGKYEVTQAQYKAVMGTNLSLKYGTNGSTGDRYLGIGDNYPVYYVSMYEAMEFCNKLNEIEKSAGRLPEGYEYTLPTEAQWEYACRAGTTTAFNNGKDITSSDACPNADEVAWYSHNSNYQTHPVGQKLPNAWGLYDMHGNVWEWCLDKCTLWDIYAVTDPLLLEGYGNLYENILRGGSYCFSADYACSAFRGGSGPEWDHGVDAFISNSSSTSNTYGFRVFLSAIRAQASAAADTLTYQWYKDGVAINGATGSSYTIKSVKTSDGGKYTVKVCNSVGCVMSEIATLTVNAAVVKPTITTQPKSQTVTEGSSATFSVTATGTAPLSYQWYKGSSKIGGATKSSYTISGAKTSDAGSYTVTVSNTAGSVTSSVATLTVNGTTPVDPNGTAVRSVNRSGKSATVTLKLEPGEDVSVMFVEEHVPSGVTISVNNGGTYIASRNMIRWSFLDGNAREISYVLTVADDFDGKVSLSGEVTFDEATVTVTGTSEIDFAILTHPADMDNDFEISTKEIASYALVWTKGQNWSREPVDIPVTYVARAAMIWVNGGYYDYDPSKTEPSCWVSTNVKPASVEAAAASLNVRSINVLDGKAYVSVEVVPADGISVYFVEEQLPAGMKLNVTDISDGGKYVEARGLIRWSFLDAEPRTLTYTLEPEVGFSGVITLNGEVTFDEETFVTEGDTEANFGGGADVPVITAAYFGGMLIEGTIGGTYVIEYSEDGVNWTKADEITLTASSMYWADLTSANSPKRLYRAKVK